MTLLGCPLILFMYVLLCASSVIRSLRWETKMQQLVHGLYMESTQQMQAHTYRILGPVCYRIDYHARQ